MDSQAGKENMSIPTRLDRYPAKMVSRLADELVERYAKNANRVLDPFCGSGAVLVAAMRRGIPVTGIDLNPVASLFSNVKINSFSRKKADILMNDWINFAKTEKVSLPIKWPSKNYWFTPVVIEKYEQLRAASVRLKLPKTNEGKALLLCFSLSVRLCSKADQRSPKPFISKQAKEIRAGKHYDPYRILPTLLEKLSDLHADRPAMNSSKFHLADITRDASISSRIGYHSHVITSPPYINAQDYFRNFKLELYFLEGILPFNIANLRERFIGTERGNLINGILKESLVQDFKRVPGLYLMEQRDSRLASVVHRYLSDMDSAFDFVKQCLAPKGVFILVCGDNLIGGLQIRTFKILQEMLEEKGFRLFDSFSDPICDRMLPPKRKGHKGLIKEEVVSAFRLN